jgi:hypothetical protein
MRGVRAIVLVGLVVVLAAGLPSSAAATVSDRLARAERRVDALADDLAARADAVTAARETVRRADARLTAASSRLAMLQDARRRLDLDLAQARAEADALRARMDTLAADAYMGASSGALDAGTVGAFLEARSLSELGDRLVFTAAASGDLSTVAADLAVAERRLEERRAVVESLVTASGIVVREAADADRAASDALASEEAAVAALDASRDRAVRLVERLRDRLDGVPPLDLSALAGALQGAHAATYGRWAELFLGVLGAPACRNNLVVVVAWQVAESTQAAWNPLATTHRMPGSTDFNGVGVQNYASLVQGLQATADTIDFGWDVYGYGAIVRSLRACERPMDTARAVNASSWCPGCVGGQYVLNVVPRVDADLATYLDL